MITASIIVATYGDSYWFRLAGERALPSADSQPAEVIFNHDAKGTLAESRNYAASLATGEWLIFLDADDELSPGYVEAILAGDGDLRTPAVQRVSATETDACRMPPALLPVRDLRHGNYLVIGTAVRKELFDAVGGFHEWALYEDWDFFIRCWLMGAEVGQVPNAVYRAWVRPGSRNEPDERTKRRIRNQIYAKHRRTPRKELIR